MKRLKEITKEEVKSFSPKPKQTLKERIDNSIINKSTSTMGEIPIDVGGI